MVDDPEQGVLIYTGTYHGVVRMDKERGLPKGEQYTPEEAFTALIPGCPGWTLYGLGKHFDIGTYNLSTPRKGR